MGININGLVKVFKSITKSAPKVGELIGTSKSGIKVYEKIGKDGARTLTSFKNGSIFKEITKEANVAQKNGNYYFNTLIKNAAEGEYTTITKHINEAGKTTGICSTSRAWNGAEDVNALGGRVLTRYNNQYFKNGKLTGLSKMEKGRYTEMVQDKHSTTVYKRGTITFPNDQVHNYSYEKYTANSAYHKGKHTWFKPYGSSGLEVTDKGVNTLPLWGYNSNATTYFKTH